MDPALLGTASAFGLAASAGLNTTLPLFIVGVLSRMGLLTLSHPFDALSSDVALVGLLLLVALEMLGDKVPGADSVVHAIQLPLAAAAGAILFASQTSVVSWVSPELTILVGLLTAGTVHVARAAIRPAFTGMTMGVANPFVSFTEDLAATALTFGAVFAPIVGVFLALVVLAPIVLLATWSVRRGARVTRTLVARARA